MYPSKHGAFTQCCFNVGPPSSTLAQHWNSIGWMPRVCWGTSAQHDCELNARGNACFYITRCECGIQNADYWIRGSLYWSGVCHLCAARNGGTPHRPREREVGDGWVNRDDRGALYRPTRTRTGRATIKTDTPPRIWRNSNDNVVINTANFRGELSKMQETRHYIVQRRGIFASIRPVFSAPPPVVCLWSNLSWPRKVEG